MNVDEAPQQHKNSDIDIAPSELQHTTSLILIQVCISYTFILFYFPFMITVTLSSVHLL